MLMVADIGNTNICFGIFEKTKLLGQFRIPTIPGDTVAKLETVIRKMFKPAGVRTVWQGAIMGSVVPKLDSAMKTALHRVTRSEVLTIHSQLPLPILNHYHPPRAVGADRLLNAVAAIHEFGAPAVIVDFGTATTVDAVSRQHAYLGGAILPGPMLAANALAQGTALLPRIKINGPVKSALGINTVQSLRSGIVLGLAGAVEKLVLQMKNELGRKTKVIATGGFVSILSPYCAVIQYQRPYLTLDGLRLCWEYNQARRSKRR